MVDPLLFAQAAWIDEESVLELTPQAGWAVLREGAQRDVLKATCFPELLQTKHRFLLWGCAGFSICFHMPRCHLGYQFLSTKSGRTKKSQADFGAPLVTKYGNVCGAMSSNPTNADFQLSKQTNSEIDGQHIRIPGSSLSVQTAV